MARARAGRGRSAYAGGSRGRGMMVLVLLVFFVLVAMDWGLADAPQPIDPAWEGHPAVDADIGYRPTLIERHADSARIAIKILAGLALLGLFTLVGLRVRTVRGRVVVWLAMAGGLACVWGLVGPAVGLTPPNEFVGPAGVVILTTLLVVQAIEAYAPREAPRRVRAVDLSSLDGMSAARFERHAHELLLVDGFVEVPERAGGTIFKSDGCLFRCHVVQSSEAVPDDEVQRAVDAAADDACDRAILVTNATLTPQARTLADEHRCAVIERPQLGALEAAYRNQHKGSPRT